MEDALDKIRPHVRSTLLNQSAPAKLLVAVEATLKEQEQEATPVAYYASFLATLQETLKRELASSDDLNVEEGAMVPSLLYLLSLVMPHVPHAVVRSNLPIILETIAPLLPLVATSAPSLRSAIGILSSVILALDLHHLTSGPPLLRQSYATLLELTVDPRPKVRKRAQEAVGEIVDSPPPPLLVHPYANQTAEYAIGVLNAVASAPGKQDSTEMGIWVCAFLKSIATAWPPALLDDLLQPLLSLPSLSSAYLTTQAYGLLSALLRAPTLTLPARTILGTLLQYMPSHHALAVPWLDAVENTMVTFARTDAEGCLQKFPNVWQACWARLGDDDVACRKAAESALCAMVRYCIPDTEVSRAIGKAAGSSTEVMDTDAKRKGKKALASFDTKTSIVETIITQLDASLHAVASAAATPSLLRVLAALITRLRPTIVGSTSNGAEALLTGLISYVGRLRLAKGFEYREQADEVLGTAIRVLGPKAFLDILPLNIIPEAPGKPAPTPGRAFLLPLLALNVTNTELQHFTTYFVPLSEKLFELKVKAGEEEKTNEAKIWEVLIAQVWACFKGYCEAPTDVKDAFTTPFARLITNLLYTQPTLRTSILQGLRTLLQTNLTLSQSSAPPDALQGSFGLSQEQAKENVEFLRSVSGNMISVLFNVFSSVASEERGLTGEVVKIWMSILPPKEVKNVYAKVTTMLTDALNKPNSSTPSTNTPPVSHTMLDLLLLLLPYLPAAPASQLLDQALGAQWIENADAGVQKRSYRLLARLLETTVLAKDETSKRELVDKLVKRIIETSEKVATGAQKDRIELFTVIVPSLSTQSQLHYIPSLLPEAILATKEVSEKARTAGFELLVAMGHKMAEEGGVVKRDLIDGLAAMDIDSHQVTASVEEFITMVSAGLVGSTPHMISATITALSRLLFEFKDSLPETMQTEMLSTVVVFLGSNNREIVKSALGFVKLCAITLPTQLVRPQLPQIVPGLLAWSHDHKNHFKTKVVHIFERMGRRFGWDAIMQNAGSENEDGRKVVENLRKRKEKAKKQKAKSAAAREEAEEDASEEEGNAPRATTGDAFEDVLYGSDSDAEESDDDRPEPSRSTKNAKGSRAVAGSGRAANKASQPDKTGKRAETRIRADDDEPMDLLHAGAANAMGSNDTRRRKPGQEAAHFKTDDSGKIVIDDETFKKNASSQDPSDDLAGQAYREQMTSVDGFTRTPTGEVKFHKNTKKRRAEEAAADALYGDGDVEMGDGTAVKPSADAKKKKKKTERVQLGHEFKAKKAGGDIKKNGGQDPYAYLPLSSVGGKKKGAAGHVKYNITGKR